MLIISFYSVKDRENWVHLAAKNSQPAAKITIIFKIS